MTHELERLLKVNLASKMAAKLSFLSDIEFTDSNIDNQRNGLETQAKVLMLLMLHP